MIAFLYNFHVIISRLGSKISSMVILFHLMNILGKDSLTYVILLFALNTLPSIFFSKIYMKIFNKIKSWKILVVLDLLSALCMFTIFISLNKIYSLFILILIQAILEDITRIIDETFFYSLVKLKDIKKGVVINNTIVSTLNIIAPPFAVFCISLLGYKNSILIDFVSFLLGAIIYLFLINMITFESNAKNEDVRLENSDIFDDKLRLLIIIMLVLAFITNLENPLMANYMKITRGMSDKTIGISMGLFSFGLFIGSFFSKLIKVITIKKLLIFASFDAIASFLMAICTKVYLIVLFNFVQGMFAMLMMFVFRVYCFEYFKQKDEFALFQTVYRKKRAMAMLISFIFGLVISRFIKESQIIIIVLAIIEFCFVLCTQLFKKKVVR